MGVHDIGIQYCFSLRKQVTMKLRENVAKRRQPR